MVYYEFLKMNETLFYYIILYYNSGGGITVVQLCVCVNYSTVADWTAQVTAKLTG